MKPSAKAPHHSRPAETPALPSDFYTRLNDWLTARRRWVLAALVALAVIVRLAFFLEARATPLVQMDKWDQTDMSYYDWWAKQILAGDLLSRNVPGPFNVWHLTIANKWLEMNPALKEDLSRQAAKENTDPQHLLWKQWLGDKTFYQEPAYSYLIALTYRFFGESPVGVFVWQMLLGVWAVVLAYRIAERHFDAVAAVGAGLLTAISAVGLMHELTLLRDMPLAFLTLLLIDLSDRALTDSKWWRWLTLGAVFGLALLVKSIFVPYLFCLLGLLVWQAWKKWRAVLVSAAALTAGLMATLSPAIIRNVSVGLPPLKITATNAGFSFIANNLPDFAWEAPNPLNEEYLPRLMGESDSSLLLAMRLTLQTHDSFRSFARIPLLKFDEIWHWWERPDNVSFYHYQLFAPLLKYLPTFFLIAPLGVVGIVLSLRHFRRHLTLYLMLGVAMLPMVVVSVMMRYRLPVVAIAILFAGFCLAWVLKQFAAQRWIKSVAATLAVLLVGFFWTGRPIPDSVPLIRRCDCTGTFFGIFREPASQAAQARDFLRAAGILEDFLQYEPPVVRQSAEKPKNPDEAMTVQFYALVQNDCAKMYAESGQKESAQAHAKRAEELQKVWMDYCAQIRP